MPTPALNKSALSSEKKRQRGYEKYLPSLELKQKQLLSVRKKHEQELAAHRLHIDRITKDVHDRLPMLAVESINLDGLVTISDLAIEEENLLGTALPVLRRVKYQRAQYSFLSRPHWVDEVAAALEHVIRLRVEEDILCERLKRLDRALRTITQRVNLFSKVLLPETQRNIKHISLFLADQDRAAVVRSKLAKRKHQLAVGLTGSPDSEPPDSNPLHANQEPTP